MFDFQTLFDFIRLCRECDADLTTKDTKSTKGATRVACYVLCATCWVKIGVGVGIGIGIDTILLQLFALTVRA
jgi:hypothetical protein